MTEVCVKYEGMYEDSMKGVSGKYEPCTDNVCNQYKNQNSQLQPNCIAHGFSRGNIKCIYPVYINKAQANACASKELLNSTRIV